MPAKMSASGMRIGIEASSRVESKPTNEATTQRPSGVREKRSHIGSSCDTKMYSCIEGSC